MSNKIVQKELEIVELWEKNNVFKKSIDQRPSDKQYVFFDGPPFATGTPHYGHILGLTSKDVYPRYFTMKGYKVLRRWGWDCHGLPIESIGENDLGLNGKQEIEAYGVGKFNNYCRSKVLSYANEWGKTVKRMGKWIDFENSYKTMDNTYIESVWWAFKKLYDEGYIYEGRKVLWYCPKSQTPISNFEIQMDNSYKDVTDTSCYVSFKVKNQELYLLAWTTTPWTLLANVAVAINPKLEYVKLTKNSKTYILAKDRVEEVFESYDKIEKISSKDVLGLEYERLYDLEVEDPSKKGWYVIDAGDEVTSTDGSGLVHMAPYGEFDYEMIKKYDLPFLEHLDNKGHFTYELNGWKDFYFKKLDKVVLEDLEARGLLTKEEDYTHSYPFSPRYDVPLINKPVPSWFVDIQKIKPKLLEKNKEINWIPSHLKNGRFHNNLLTAPDWNISRNRFWASALPVWKSDDGEILKVIGSVKELQELATTNVSDDVDLHKDALDKIKLKDPKTGKVLTRVPEVFDCWFESASMPFASNHYPFENKELVENNLPADFISEYIGQVRAWFYVMHVLGVLLFDKPSYKNVVTTGTILAEDGSKMSKSRGNFPDPMLIFEKYGADALRFYLMGSNLMRARDLNFNETHLKDVYRKIIVILSNVKSFFELYADKVNLKPDTSDVLNAWIVSKTESLNKKLTKHYDEYDSVQVCLLLQDFIEDLSTWYVRRSRDNFKVDGPNKDKSRETLAYVLHKLSLMMAPITPFIAEDIHRSLAKHVSLNESVHLEAWPNPVVKNIDEKLEEDMVKVREVVSLILDQREKVKIPIRQALLSAKVSGYDLSDKLSKLILDETNIKKIEYVKGEPSASLDTTMTPELEKEGMIRDLIRKLNQQRKNMGLTIDDKITLHISSNSKLFNEAISDFEDELKNSIQATKIVSSGGKEAITIKDVEVSFEIKL